MAAFFIVVAGPTAVGKTDFALELAQKYNGEIINADVGQFYTPLSIGTAKPDWRNLTIPHHLFDILSEPKDYTVHEYRKAVYNCMKAIWQRNRVPIIVGGSGFYLMSLYFPPQELPLVSKISGPVSWEALNAIDPVRAQEINPSDFYRIERALAIWYATGKKPSAIKPVFNPLAPSFFIVLDRDRQELYNRINRRVCQMLQAGWICEVQALMGTDWIPFLERKKLIGYPEIIAFLKEQQTDINYQTLVAQIQQKTRNYAKRQLTFFAMLQKMLAPYSTTV
jgi:tRNA dimethylallyltransferase